MLLQNVFRYLCMSNKNNKGMKNYTAIYDTKKYQNIEYNFDAENLEKANEFAETKFDHENISNFRIKEEN